MSESVKEKNNEFFRLIRSALESHKLAFMIGAGVSRATDERNPSWPELIDYLKQALDNCEEDDFLKIAQLYNIKYGPLNLKNKVQSRFPPKDIPGRIQKDILELNPHYIITTNWDCYFDNLVKKELQYPYDVVANDRELVHSKNDNKIIKMHGDFAHGNYVFTEDDYLNYSYNFPLIENYVKSIFSTHAIVMLGYSFNDIDLKQIITWFQNHSKQQPPVYMVVYNHDEYKQQYLEKFGIKTIVIEIDELKDNKKSSKNEKLTKGLLSFLETLKIDVDAYTSNPALLVYGRLKGFEQLRNVLQRHLLKALTNCTIEGLSSSDVLLHFFDSLASTDFDERVRKIYREFVDNIESEKEHSKIIPIFLKSGINGIVTTKDNDRPLKWSLFEKNDETENIFTFLDFSAQSNSSKIEILSKNVALLYNNKKLEEAFKKNKEFLILCKETSCYEWLLIGLYNHNVILNEMQYNPNLKRKYVDNSHEDIEKHYSVFPKDIQQDCLYLKDFLLQKDLYEMLFWTNQAVEKKKEQAQCIGNGGACWDSDAFRYEHEHRNLIEFVIGNGICMEKDLLYKRLCSNYVEIAFIRKSIAEEFSLNKVELFTCIKYLSTKDLKRYFDYLDFEKIKFCFDKNLIDYLIEDAFEGLVSLFKDKHDLSLGFDKCILHTLILLSLNKLDDIQTHKIFELMNILVSKSLNTPNIFKAINTFFANQWHLYQKKYDDQEIVNMLVNLLNRFIINNINGYEYDAICKHGSSNIFNLTEYLTKKIESISLIKRIILIVNDEKDEEEKLPYCENILVNLYRISNEECKKEIEIYLKDVKFSPNNFWMKIKLINYKIQLIRIGIKNNIKEVLKDLNKILDNFNTSVMCSDLNYTCALFNAFTKEQKKAKSKALSEILSTQKKLKKIVEESNDMSSWLSVI